MICDQCTSLLRQPQFSNESAYSTHTTVYGRNYQMLHPTVASLQHSLGQGCGFCHKLVRAIRTEGFEVIPAPGILASLMVLCHLAFETESKRVISCLAEFRGRLNGKAWRERCTICLFLAPGLNTRTRSLYTITGWLDKCERNHVRCRQVRNTTSSRRFARILDVSPSALSSAARLVLSTALPSDVRYMTLSHCWGNASNIPVLTTENYNDHFDCIAYDSLPNTFSDAIDLTRALNVRYLWIDCLCIVQNSPEDWSREAMIMGEVYQGSYLNIAASRSQNPYGGLFTSRNLSEVAPLRVDFGNLISSQVPSTTDHSQIDEPVRLELEGTASLRISGNVPSDCATKEVKFDLNRYLGNENGAFDRKGENFAHTARNVRLVDDVLHADLAKRNEQWETASINLRELSFLSRYRFTFTQLRFFGISGLVLSYRVPDTIDLNACLGNNDGSFDPKGVNFSSTARNVRLDGHLLLAELCTLDGRWKPNSLDLSPFVDAARADTSPSESQRRYYDVDTDSFTEWQQNITNTKLCGRGWVLQERLLAPRVLHFGKDQLYWECLEMQSSEDRPDVETDLRLSIAHPGLRAAWAQQNQAMKALDPFEPNVYLAPSPRALGARYIQMSADVLLDPKSVSSGVPHQGREALQELKHRCYGKNEWLPTHGLIRFWARILQAYVPTELTYYTDRLVAIAGVAKLLSQRSGIRYVAGLWEHQLPRQLLWSFVQYRPNVQNTEYTGPSWSWASTPEAAAISFAALDPLIETHGAMDLIKVLSIDLHGETEHDIVFGRVRSGCLHVRGRLLPISLNTKHWPTPSLRKDKLVQFYMGSSLTAPTGAIFLLPIIFTRWSEELPGGTPNSLILEWTGRKGVFKRVGTARISYTCPLKNVVNDLIDAQIDDAYPRDDAEDLGDPCEEEIQLSTHSTYPSRGGPLSPQLELWAAKLERFSLVDLEEEYRLHALQTNHPIYRVLVTYHMRRVRRQLRQAETMFASRIALEGARNEQGSTGMGAPNQGPQNRVSTLIQNQFKRHRRLKQIPPKQAVKSKYYLDYLDDEESTQFGHFVFDII